MRFIAAIDEKRGMADDNGIPWNLPTDQKFFVDQVRTGIVLMGKGTYLEFKKPMHGRTNYVATTGSDNLLPGFEAVHNLPEFIQAHSEETIQNIGGARLFAATLQFADELILTQVYADFHCTKFFPEYEQDFYLVSHEEPITENGVTFRYETWRRKQ